MELFEKIVDAATGEEILRPYTKEEIAVVEAEAKKAKIRYEELANREAARKAALSKLIDLGLTEEEIAALQANGRLLK